MEIRVEWFLNKFLGTCHVVVDCYGTPNPKFYFDLLLFTYFSQHDMCPNFFFKNQSTLLYTVQCTYIVIQILYSLPPICDSVRNQANLHSMQSNLSKLDFPPFVRKWKTFLKSYESWNMNTEQINPKSCTVHMSAQKHL